MSCVVGIDKGTTATKAVVFDADTGAVLGSAHRPTKALYSKPGWHEEDMEATFAGVAACIRAAISDARIDKADVVGVGVSGHMGGLWALDGEGNPVGNAIAWPDSRAADLLEQWTQSGIVDRIYAVSGNAPIAGVPMVLLAWLKQHDPERYARIRTLFFAKDYINYRLTGRVATDESDISFFPCDIRARCFSSDLLEIAGISDVMEALPQVLPTGAQVGVVSSQAARMTGLREGTPVVTGAGDAVAAALGAGAVSPGQAVTVIGTSFMNNLTTDRPLMEPHGVGFLFLMPDGNWQRLMANTGGGSLCLDWALQAFCNDQLLASGDDKSGLFAEIETSASVVAPLSDGLITHPYFNTSGMSAPRFIPSARASIFGVDTATSPSKLIRSVMEGVAFSMVECYGALEAQVDEIRLTGGGARSPLWRSICAAAINKPLQLLEAEETGALGVAVLASIASGAHTDNVAATSKMVRVSGTQTPDRALSDVYRSAYPLFRDLGQALTPLWERRAKLLSQQANNQEK